MSRGGQHRSWSARPRNRALMEQVKSAHFLHSHGLAGDSGLTYQSCRFCGTACFQNEDRNHGQCTLRRMSGHDHCRGLWKYQVRHYICSDCRRDVLLGLQPAKSRTKIPPADLREARP